MTILALFSLLLLLVSALLIPTHLWWGAPFSRWYEAEGRQMLADTRAYVAGLWGRAELWGRVTGRFRRGGVATARLERFAERQSMDVASVNPFGEANELPRRSLRALGRELTAPIPISTPRDGPRAPRTSERAGPTEGQASLSRTFVVVSSPEMTQQLARSARRGDIWLNLTRFEVGAPVRQRRQALVDELAQHPEWTDEVLYQLGVAIGLWHEAGPFAENRSRNRQRIRRLRAAAVKRLTLRSAA